MRDYRMTVSTLVLAGLASTLGGTSLAAGPSASPANKPAKLEAIPGSDLKRVVLTPKAAERLAIQTAPVKEEPVNRWLSVQGEVEHLLSPRRARERSSMLGMVGSASLASASGTMTDADPLPVRIRVSMPDPLRAAGRAIPLLSLKDVDDDDDVTSAASSTTASDEKPQTVIIVPIGAGPKLNRLKAKLSQLVSAGGVPASPNAQYYVLQETQHGLRPGQPVYVRVPQPGSGTPQKVIPYSAVVYDADGKTWTYTSPEPLVFVRHRIDVEHIQGDLAVLKEGPPSGTQVVTAGAMELLGFELKFGY